jgi:uncharacterized protein YkwD
MNKLKKYFIPHEENNYRPHFFHYENALLVVLFVLGVELLSFVTVKPMIQVGGQNTGAVLLSVLGGLTNNERLANNVPELQINPLLAEAAQMKADDMAKNGYFAHTSPEGKTPWYWLNQVDYKYEYAGENLAINFTDTKDVTDAWMASPTHRANIVKSAYTEMGSGMAVGMYQGVETIFVVQDYGNPKVESVKSVNVKTPKVSSTVSTKDIPTPGLTGTTSEVAKVQILGEETVNASTTNATSSVSVVSSSSPIVQRVAGSQSVMKANFIQIILSSPRHLADRILFGILIFVIFALALKMAINFRVQHWDLIRNGLLIIAVIISLYLVNSYLSTQTAPTTSTFDYSVQQTNL